ncbi:GNAT family N-acetyltransferase [Pseudactinotalea sp. HY160]|uniref:GNAT family N-acetyltransferase n=1 Tax=Pseudactinotalea sp. HY160 TaxID=2654490 RepID=UPI00128B3117|nr:GNAT family N-acetyltransferase [Pseudactinotalea sp. HY160]MPV51092.1 GNAT family N-acetyltransferase [Pseudactinotalea sp. HY160]
MSDGVTVRHDPQRSRFVVAVEGEDVGVAAYHRDPGTDRWVFDHTVVEPAHGGQGLAGRLVRYALDQAVAVGGVIVPACSYVAAYVRHHPEYADHVAERQDVDERATD